MDNIQVTDYCRHVMDLQVKEGDICVDATMGNGHDTIHLAALAGENGRVHAFDIQEKAIQTTQKGLEEMELSDRVSLHLESHENMGLFLKPDTVSCIVFNLGYLPGGDHALATKAATTIVAMEQALKLLKRGGVLLACIYSGGDTGYEEKHQVLDFAAGLDPKGFLVMKTDFFNRRNDPPVPLVIVKL